VKIKEALAQLKEASHSIAIRKRGADWLGKVSVVALAIGVFQAQTTSLGFMGIIVSIISGVISFWLTLKMQKESR
jgi:hypothetical protein